VKTLFKSLLAEDFVIDEQPEPIYLSREEGQEDLTEIISKMMIDNERLESLNVQLQERSGDHRETERILRNILPTLDSFDRVLHLGRSYPQSPEMDNWLKSVESIYFRLLGMLENYGLFQLNTVGNKVDLNMHEVVEYRKSEDHPNDVVISERQKGYVFRGKLLRDAKVVVAYNERS
jgi:molecular chaperone GrpE